MVDHHTTPIQRSVSDLTLAKKSHSAGLGCPDGLTFLADETLTMNQKIAAVETYKPLFKGMLELIIGPMFAGKSTELMRRVKRHGHSGKSCLFVKYANDTRYSKD